MNRNKNLKKAKSLRNSKLRNRRDPETLLRPSYRGQPVLEIWVDLDGQKLTSTVTTGVTTGNLNVGSGGVSNFSTRFAMWDEYRVVAYDMDSQSLGSTLPGLAVMWFEEKDFNAPSLAKSLTNNGKRFPLSADQLNHHIKGWFHDPLDLQYNAITTAYQPGALKVYSDNAQYGAPIVATDVLYITGKVLVQFRGFV